MSERYKRLFGLPNNLYAAGAPVMVAAGALLRDEQTGKLLAQLKLRNLSPVGIKAVTVSIQPMDAAGQSLGEELEHHYLDMDIPRDGEFGQKQPAFLPDAATRAFSVTVKRAIFFDGSQWHRDDTPWQPISAPVTLESAFDDGELVKEYRLQYGSSCRYLPRRQEDLWMCSCGALNHQDEPACHTCGQQLALLWSVDMDELRTQKDHRLEETAKAAAAARAVKKANCKKMLRISAVTLVLLLIISAVGAVILTKPDRVKKEARALADVGDYMAAVAVLDEYDRPEKTQSARQTYLYAMERQIGDAIVAGEYENAMSLIETYTVLDTAQQNIGYVQQLCHHQWEEIRRVEHTCTEDGFSETRCTVCHLEEKTVFTASGHQFASQITRAATCTLAGEERFTCSVCQLTESKSLEILPHDPEVAVTKAPTCTETGVETSTCKVCGHAENTDIPMVEHTNKTVVVRGATCTAAGAKQAVCTVCGNKGAEEPIAMITHSFQEVVLSQPTCTAEGIRQQICTVCKAGGKKTAIAALGHNYAKHTETVVTCTEDGIDRFSCSRCEDTYTQPVTAPGHKWVSATCTKAKNCTICGLTEGEALGHDWKVSSSALKCSRCSTTRQPEFQFSDNIPYTYEDHESDYFPSDEDICGYAYFTDLDISAKINTIWSGETRTVITAVFHGYTEGEQVIEAFEVNLYDRAGNRLDRDSFVLSHADGNRYLEPMGDFSQTVTLIVEHSKYIMDENQTYRIEIGPLQ